MSEAGLSSNSARHRLAMSSTSPGVNVDAFPKRRHAMTLTRPAACPPEASHLSWHAAIARACASAKSASNTASAARHRRAHGRGEVNGIIETRRRGDIFLTSWRASAVIARQIGGGGAASLSRQAPVAASISCGIRPSPTSSQGYSRAVAGGIGVCAYHARQHLGARPAQKYAAAALACRQACGNMSKSWRHQRGNLR